MHTKCVLHILKDRHTHMYTRRHTYAYYTYVQRQIDTYTHICILLTLGDRKTHIEALEHSYTRKSW